MTRTLKAGEYQLVLTQGVSNKILGSTQFSEFVWRSLLRFNKADWGQISDGDIFSVAYTLPPQQTIWIVREIIDEDGSQEHRNS